MPKHFSYSEFTFVLLHTRAILPTIGNHQNILYCPCTVQHSSTGDPFFRPFKADSVSINNELFISFSRQWVLKANCGQLWLVNNVCCTKTTRQFYKPGDSDNPNTTVRLCLNTQ